MQTKAACSAPDTDRVRVVQEYYKYLVVFSDSSSSDLFETYDWGLRQCAAVLMPESSGRPVVRLHTMADVTGA